MNYITIDISNATKQFIEAIQTHGLNPPMSINPGKFYRFPGLNKDHKNKAAYCKLFNEGLGGIFGDFSSNIHEIFQIKSDKPLSPEKQSKLKLEIEKNRSKINLERKQIQLNSQNEANNIWHNSIEINNHPYLNDKKINSYGLRQYQGNKVIAEMVCHNAILIPLYGNNEIYSLQFIQDSNNKRFLYGGRKDGCYFIIGDPDKCNIICIAEGYATGASIFESTGYTVVIAFDSGNLLSVTEAIKNKYSDKTIVICADDDFTNKVNTGLNKATEAASKFGVKLSVPLFGKNRPNYAKDFNDLLQIKGSKAVLDIINSSVAIETYPIPLPTLSHEVKELNKDMLPECIRDYIFDIAERQQCPPDFVAVTAIIALSSLLGRKAIMQVKMHDNWFATPNQWGVIIGRPSAMKSPSMKAALMPLRKIEEDNARIYDEQLKEFNIEQELSDIDKPIKKKKITKLLNSGDKDMARELLESNDKNTPPIRKRLIINDSTIEKLGELLNENPNGLMLVRDELSGWLSILMREDGQQDRAFYLECFDGDNKFSYHRIGRGTIEINNCTLSLIGGIQPTKISNLVYQAMIGIADDGLIQRLQLATWPKDNCKWQWIDRAPNKAAQDKYFQTFKTLNELIFNTDGGAKIFSFTPEAQELCKSWNEELHELLKSDDINPLIESHLLKMPQTIASLALLFEIITGGRDVVDVDATIYAIGLADYFRSHAEKIYNIIGNAGINGAKLILKRKNKLPDPFVTRDIQRKKWSGLFDTDIINDAISYLVEYRHLIPTEVMTTIKGGRPTIGYTWNKTKPNNHT